MGVVTLETPYTKPAQTLIITDIIVPACGDKNSPVEAKIYNNGSTTVNTFNLSYKLNGVQIASAETANLTILPGDTATYKFNTKADLSIDGNYG